jgi:hypothetical protein
MFAHALGAAAGLGYVKDDRGVSDELIGSRRFEIRDPDRQSHRTCARIAAMHFTIRRAHTRAASGSCAIR